MHTRGIKQLKEKWHLDLKPGNERPANDHLVTEDLELEQELTEKVGLIKVYF